MYDYFVDDTRSFYESCTRTDGTFPDPEDEKYYNNRLQIQLAVEADLFEL